MRSRLDQIEDIFKELIEGSSILFPWMGEQSSLIHKLVESIEECLEDYEPAELRNSPEFSIYLNPEDSRFLKNQSGWEKAVNDLILEISTELGFHFEDKPGVKIITRQSLIRGEVQVSSTIVEVLNGATNAVPVAALQRQEGNHSAQAFKASLILDDDSLFPLDKPVINIGRKSSNHLILNDVRVSRTHAQIRAVPDGFIIFDIGSTGGTYINGERIYQRKLKTGDVISLAGIKIIYIEEATAANESQNKEPAQTKPFIPTENLQC